MEAPDSSFIHTCYEGLTDFNRWADTTCCDLSFCFPVGAAQLAANVSCAVVYNTLGIASFVGSLPLFPRCIRTSASQFRRGCFKVGSEGIAHSGQAGINSLPLIGALFAKNYMRLQQARDEQAKQIETMRHDTDQRISQLQASHTQQMEAQRTETAAVKEVLKDLSQVHGECPHQKEELQQKIDSLTQQLGQKKGRMDSLRSRKDKKTV